MRWISIIVFLLFLTQRIVHMTMSEKEGPKTEQKGKQHSSKCMLSDGSSRKTENILISSFKPHTKNTTQQIFITFTADRLLHLRSTFR